MQKCTTSVKPTWGLGRTQILYKPYPGPAHKAEIHSLLCCAQFSSEKLNTRNQEYTGITILILCMYLIPLSSLLAQQVLILILQQR